MEKKRLFTIGEFAKLNHINKKTLEYYDEINLFKPYAIKENKYRYYSHLQFSDLQTILMLKELNVSLKDIIAYMKNKSKEALTSIFNEKIKDIDQTINHLQQIKQALVYQNKEMEELDNIDINKYYIKNLEEQQLIILKTSKYKGIEKETTAILNEIERHKKYRKYGINFGSMIHVDKVCQSNIDDYDAIFLDTIEQEKQAEIHHKPKGKYLVVYNLGSFDTLSKKYQEILSYVQNNNLKLQGFSYEFGINENVINNENEYLTRIEIMIE